MGRQHNTHMRSATSGALLYCVVLLSAATANSSPDRIRARSDGFLVDGYGRVRIFRGFNDVQHSKGSGFKPGGPDYLPKAVVHEWIVSNLEEQGFNVMRIPMMWAATMPTENSTDQLYLDNTAHVVQTMRDHNIYALLDMHQDVLSSRLADSAGDTGYDGAPRWLVDRTVLKKPYPWPWTPPLKSWGDGYLTKATGQCFQDIYDNTHGGLDAWAEFWQVVADRFKSQTSVLGYELINEPWVGDQFAHPLLMVPGEAGARSLSKPYAVLAKAIREKDNETAIFFEPVTWGMIFGGKVTGSGFSEAPDTNSVLTFHYYCWFAAGGNGSAPFSPLSKAACDKGLGPQVFDAIKTDTNRLKVPSFMSEWGGKSPRASMPASRDTIEINRNLDLADEHFTSWTMYDLVSILPHNYNDTWTDDVWDVLKVYSRPYAQAVAGTPTKMTNAWQVKNGTMTGTKFVLEFSIGNATQGCEECACSKPVVWPASGCDVSCGAKCGEQCCCIVGMGSCKPTPAPSPGVITEPTEISVPPLWFPDGFVVELSPGLSWSMAKGRRNVVAVWINATESVPKSGTVTITTKTP